MGPDQGYEVPDSSLQKMPRYFTYYYYEDDGTTVYNPNVSIPNNATNRLAYVTDASVNNTVWSTDLDGQGVGNYDYNDIGQLIQDNREKIETIEWTVGNKVSKVTRTSTSSDPDLEFKYDAGGNRVIKIVKPKDGTTLTDEEDWTFTYYVRDASGNVLTTYTKSTTIDDEGWIEEFAADEHHLYGNKRLGLKSQYNPAGYLSTTYAAWTNTGTSGTTNPDGSFDEDLLVHAGGLMPAANTVDENNYSYQLGGGTYECSNHLGNVLATVSDKPIEEDDNTDNLLDGLMADVVSYSDYYPYGMEMPGRSFTPSESYRYGFNGMEKDDELKGTGNSYTTHFRQYDSRLGRWLSLDPLVREFPAISPFVGMGNNPVTMNDMKGDSVMRFDGDGNFLSMYDDGKTEWKGQYQVYSEATDKYGNAVMTYKDFEFNDPKTDVAGIKNGVITKLSFQYQEARIDNIMNSERVKGASDNLEESSRDGVLDFKHSQGLRRSTLYLPDNGKAYNHYDFGNFLWGNAMHSFGKDYDITRLAAHLNNALHGKREEKSDMSYGDGNGAHEGHRIFDSDEDQRAIHDGYWYPLSKEEIDEAMEQKNKRDAFIYYSAGF